ncbi:MAG: hypothetical protein ACPLKQ_08640 [Candidatus Bathyarchaeales archaeon]
MTANSSNETQSDFLREIKKLEARLNDFLKEEEAFIGKLRNFIEKLKDAHDKIGKLKNNPQELAALKLEITQALKDVLESEGEAQHERSHLLESYGALILALEEEFKRKSLQL